MKSPITFHYGKKSTFSSNPAANTNFIYINVVSSQHQLDYNYNYNQIHQPINIIFTNHPLPLSQTPITKEIKQYTSQMHTTLGMQRKNYHTKHNVLFFHHFFCLKQFCKMCVQQVITPAPNVSKKKKKKSYYYSI